MITLKYPATKTTESVLPEDDNDWVSVANIGANDGVYSYITAATYDANDISYRMKAQNFGFSIPADAVIDGITVQIERRTAAGSAVDYRVQLLDDTGALVGNNKADTVNVWPGTDTMKSYGGTTDNWGWTTMTPAKLNNANFGIVLSAKATAANTDIYVDYIRIAVHTGTIEDFTTYTEVDTAAYLTVTSSRVTSIANEDIPAYVYKNFTANYFDALDVDVEFYVASAAQNASQESVAFTNTIGDGFAMTTTGDLRVDAQRRLTEVVRFQMTRALAVYDQWDQAAGTNTIFYYTISRSAGGDVVEVYVYTDSARTTLVDVSMPLSLAGFGTVKWQYGYGHANLDVDNVDRIMDGYTQNMDLNITAPPSTAEENAIFFATNF